MRTFFFLFNFYPLGLLLSTVDLIFLHLLSLVWCHYTRCLLERVREL